MEEARSLEPRRVTVEFRPQRMAEAILSLAFEQVLENSHANPLRKLSEQSKQNTDCVKACLSKETCQ